MRVIAAKNLADFAERHPEAKASLTHWRVVANAAKWASIGDVQSAFPKAKALNGERVLFEIAGGNYRLIVAFDFDHRVAFIKFIGSHTEYDRIDALTVTQF